MGQCDGVVHNMCSVLKVCCHEGTGQVECVVWSCDDVCDVLCRKLWLCDLWIDDQ